MARSPRSKRFLLTVNNPTEGEKVLAAQTCIEAKYGIVCREIGPENGQPHIHFFFILHSERAVSSLKAEFPRANIQVFRGKSEDGRKYCKKGGDYDEYGDFPDQQGKRSEFDNYRDWLLEHDRIPTEKDVAFEWPSLYGRYRSNCLRMLSLLRPRVATRTGELKDWQDELKTELENDPDDRTIKFMVDYSGGKGKTWFCLHMFGEKADDVQYMSIAKRDDLAHMIDEQKTIFLMDVPRDQMQFLNYSILEQIKNGVVSSPKYESRMKVMRDKCHVVVFCNEQPDRSQLSEDRFDIVTL